MVNINMWMWRGIYPLQKCMSRCGAELKSEQAAEVLNKAAGFLRSLISKEMTMRSTPRLQFFYDYRSSRPVLNLIDKAVASDKKAGATLEGLKTLGRRRKMGALFMVFGPA